ncbi:MAG: hypothetical protein JWP74_2179 [Marmoricola sp.]|nr:hypothetical protein [Marmoricola sp.]
MAVEGDRDAALDLLKKGSALDAAQVMADGLGGADFAKFIRDTFETPAFVPSRLHELILEIDPKVVITTNYDTILDGLAQTGKAVAGYNTCRYHDSHLVNDLRSNRRIIIKAHGCVSDPQKVVLTRRQYFAAQRDYPPFFAALDAIFLTSTLLFVGTGFNGDPDIELLLQNGHISAPSDHPHYALVEEGRHPSVRMAIEETYNVKFLEYPKGAHDEVVKALEVLAEDVAAYRSVGGF